MDIRNDDRSIISFREHQLKRRFQNLIQGLQRNLKVSSEELSDILRVNPEELKKRSFAPNVDQIASLASRFHFSLERFYSENVDLEILKQHMNGNKLALAAKYTPAAFSKRQIIINMLNYVESIKGRQLKHLLMDHLYLTDAIYLDPEGPVNVLLFEDATQYLLKMHLEPNDIVMIGRYTPVSNRNSVFARELTQPRTVAEMYEYYLTELIKTVEHNNLYQLRKLSATDCVLESHENPELLDTLKVQHAGGIGRCLCRAGALAAAPVYRHLPLAHVVETSCVTRGDDICRFHIDFSMAAAAEVAR